MARQRKRLVIYPYNPFWKSLFADEEQLLRVHLQGEYKSIIHIGSTSIEGMQAKPTIDIAIALNELHDKVFYEEKLLPIGYKFCTGGKYRDWILFDREDCGQWYHVHLMPYDSMRLFKQVMFKIFMEENPAWANVYAKKKIRFLATDDHIWYSMNKEPFVDEMNLYALLDAIERPNFWNVRIESIMGYIPYAELFTIEEQGEKQTLLKIAYRLIKNRESIKMAICEVLEGIGLTRKEMDYLLEH